MGSQGFAQIATLLGQTGALASNPQLLTQLQQLHQHAVFQENAERAKVEKARQRTREDKSFSKMEEQGSLLALQGLNPEQILGDVQAGRSPQLPPGVTREQLIETLSGLLQHHQQDKSRTNLSLGVHEGPSGALPPPQVMQSPEESRAYYGSQVQIPSEGFEALRNGGVNGGLKNEEDQVIGQAPPHSWMLGGGGGAPDPSVGQFNADMSKMLNHRAALGGMGFPELPQAQPTLGLGMLSNVQEESLNMGMRGQMDPNNAQLGEMGGNGGGDGEKETHRVKCFVEGSPFGVSVDLSRFNSTQELRESLLSVTEGTSVVYQDKDGDMILLGDESWPFFLHSVRRMYIRR